MFFDQSTQIRVLLQQSKMVNIGGRPVLVSPAVRKNSPKLLILKDKIAKLMPAKVTTRTIQLALAFAAIYLVWGSTYLAIRYAVETIPPLVTAEIRHATAGSILLIWAWLRGYRPTLAHWKAGFVLGALFFLIGHGSLHWAEQYVGSGLAALLIATEPMFILILAWMAGQQKISKISALGLGLGIVGVAVLTGAELSAKSSSLIGLLAVLTGSLSWAAGVVISPKLKLPEEAIARTAVPLVCGAVMLLAAAALTGEFHVAHWSTIAPRSIMGLAYLITFGSIVAFTAYTWLLQQCPPALVATHTYANPIVAVLLGWIFVSEPLTLRVAVASVAILGAIVLIRRGEGGITAQKPVRGEIAIESRAIERAS